MSEFNCSLRSRCSMEMWCPDDTGRDSRDWVGPPAWRRACFNSPEWGGGSSPVKTEPLQIVLLLLLFWTQTEARRMCMSTDAILIGMGALDGKELFAIEGPEKLALNSGRTRRSAKKWPRGRKTPSNRLAAINTAIQLVGIMSRFPVRTARGLRVPRRKYVILPKARGLTQKRSTNCS